MIQCRSSRKRDEIPRHTLFFPPPPAPNDVGAARGIIKPSSYRSRDMLAGGLKETRVSNLVRGRLVFLSLRATSITLQVFFFFLIAHRNHFITWARSLRGSCSLCALNSTQNKYMALLHLHANWAATGYIWQIGEWQVRDQTRRRPSAFLFLRNWIKNNKRKERKKLEDSTYVFRCRQLS